MNPDPSPEPVTGKPRKILVVDDDAIILRTLSFKLEAAGYEVCTALDGGTAVSAVRKEKPDLILLDISFPPDVAHGGGVPWDGFMIIDWLRRLEEAKHTPIIVITGGDPVQYQERSRQTGAAAFFRKPLDHEGLIEVVRRHLGEVSTAATPSFDTTPRI